MEICQYPIDPKGEGPDVLENLYNSLKKKKKKFIRLQLRAYIKVLKKAHIGNLDVYYKTPKLTRLGNGVSEIRIPPDNCSAGVSRVYFITHPEKPNAMLILYAEFKKDEKDDTGFDTAKKIKRRALEDYAKKRKT